MLIMAAHELLAKTTANNTSIFCGVVFWYAILLAGIIKCIQIMRRPTTSTTCVLSLAFFLGGWLVATAIGQLLKTSTPADPPMTGGVMVALWLAAVGLLVAAPVLAIVGLIQYGRGEVAYSQGRWQAATALLLSLGTIALVWQVVVARTQLAKARTPAPVAANRQTDYTFEKYNFRLHVPGESWAQIDLAAVTPATTVAFARSKPHTLFTVIAETIGTQHDLTAEMLANVAQAHLKSAGADVQMGRQRPKTVAGVEGLTYTCTATVAGQRLSYSNWIGLHNGYAWQLITYGPEANTLDVREAADAFAQGFRLIDADRVAVVAGAAAENVDAPQYGYRLRMGDSGWMKWDSIDEDYPEAHAGALYGTSVAMGVVPLRLDGLAPTDAELATALLKTLDMEYPKDVSGGAPYSLGAANGYVFDATRSLESVTYTYQLHVLRNGDFAYLLAAWAAHGSKTGMEKAVELVRKVEFLDSADTARDLTEKERALQALLFANLAMVAHDADHIERAIDYAKRAFAYDDDNGVYLNDVVDLYDILENYQVALEFLDAHIERFPASHETHANRAYQLGQLDRHKEAAEIYGRIFAAGFSSDVYFDDYLSQLVTLEQYDQAHAAIDAALARHPTRDLRLWKARVCSEQEQYKEAIDILRELLDTGIFDAEVAYQLADSYWGAGQYDDGIKVCQQLIDNSGETAGIHALKGCCELGLKRYADAKRSFENATRLDPTDDDSRQLLMHASGMLGQGDNSSVRKPIDPVQIPTAINNQMQVAPTADEATIDEHDETCVLNYVIGVEFDDSEVCKQTKYSTIAIRTRRGINDFSTLDFRFDPLCEEIYVNWLTVRDANGEVIGTGDIDTYYVTDSTSDETASRDKVLHVPVPGLAVGHVLDVAVTTRDTSAPDRWPYEVHAFTHVYPTRYHAFFARGDIQHLSCQASGDLRFDSAPDALCWSLAGHPAYRYESLQPRYDRWLPTVAFADSRLSWEDEAREYLGKLADHPTPDEETRSLAARLTSNLTDQEDILAALTRHVQSEYTYKAIAFGRRASIPNTAESTIRNRYGDCKDHSLLLRQLLQSVDLHANLALVNSSGVVHPDLPSLDQFDHMIVHLGGPGGDRFFDCTNKSADVMAAQDYALADQHILVLDPDAPHLVKTATYAGPDTISVERTVELVDGTHASVDETLTVTGVYAQRMRAFLDAFDEARHREVLQQLMASRGAPRIQDLELIDRQSLDKPIGLHMKYTVRDVMHEAHDELIGRLPTMWESHYMEADVVDARQSPFEIDVPTRLESKTRFVLPDNTEAANLATLARQSESRFAKWSVDASQSSGTLVLQCSADEATGSFPAEDYAEYYQAIQDLLNALSPRVVLSQQD
ncbi:MAG: tetratricopeptide repeat protein [Phycisphaerae bacterium]|nr:tetratricopeptide repeat protein [Phycisphaerae bacterium]